MATLKAEVLELRQIVVGLQMSLDTYRTEQQQQRMQFEEIRTWFSNRSVAPAQAPKQPETRLEPWRLPLQDFVAFRDVCPANWEDNGNAKVAQRLARALKRTSGHAEGQLYIDWCAKNGSAAVKAFWISRGFSGVPEGL